jgi:hypothetical protein
MGDVWVKLDIRTVTNWGAIEEHLGLPWSLPAVEKDSDEEKDSGHCDRSPNLLGRRRFSLFHTPHSAPLYAPCGERPLDALAWLGMGSSLLEPADARVPDGA